MITVLYPVNRLVIGGAERQLLELVRGLDRSRFRPIVAPVYADGELRPEFAAVPGLELVDLDRRGKLDPTPPLALRRLIRARGVDVVQPFLSPATVFSLLAALRQAGVARVLTERCGVRHFRGWGPRAYFRLERLLARTADVVVANSEAGRTMALRAGLPAGRIQVIHNGIDLERVRPDPDRVAALRAELGAGPAGTVVGVLATLKPAKDHRTFLAAAALVSARDPDVRFAIVGDGPLRAELQAEAARLGLAGRVHFCGAQRRVADHLAACDLLVSSSRDNEGHSNSILEAMLAGVPVVATTVGGNRELVEPERTGLLVPVGDPLRLAAAIERLIDDRPFAAALAGRAREQVETRFGLARMVAEYEALYERLLTARRRTARELVGASPAG